MKFNNIEALIENSINIPENKKFCAIIGSNPSHGARSPLLWNAAFEKMNIDMTMIPLDCKPTNIFNLLEALEKTQSFVGGAIAAPFKENTAKWLNKKITKESKAIGAVNCIFRNELNQLTGTNTDGEAAIISIKKNLGTLNNKKILILGTGGTAKAITAYLIPELNSNGELIIVGRNFNKLGFSSLYKQTKVILWKDLQKTLYNINLVINCTSIGWGEQSTKSPMPKELLDLLPNSSKIFDVIYDPNPTIFLSYAKEKKFDTLNGSDMNLEQAVLAYTKVNNIRENLEKIKIHMLSAIN